MLMITHASFVCVSKNIVFLLTFYRFFLWILRLRDQAFPNDGIQTRIPSTFGLTKNYLKIHKHNPWTFLTSVYCVTIKRQLPYIWTFTQNVHSFWSLRPLLNFSTKNTSPRNDRKVRKNYRNTLIIGLVMFAKI